MPTERQRDIITNQIRSALAIAFKEVNPPFIIDWKRSNVDASLQVLMVYRGRWWTVSCASQGEIVSSVDGIKLWLSDAITDDAFKREEYVEDFMTKTNPSKHIETILQQRGSTHGDFGDNATCALQLRDVMRSMKPHWSNCTAEQRLALEEIALKIARILSGGNKEIDNWNDGAGYFMLGAKSCE